MSKKNNYFTLPTIFLLSLFFQFISYNKYISPGIEGANIVVLHYLIPFHTPGYPLYSIIGKLFAWLPLSDTGFKIILMSSFFTALSGVLLYVIVCKLLILDSKEYFRIKIASIFSVFLFIFSPTFLFHGITASVYPILGFLTLCISLLVINDIISGEGNFNIYLLLSFISGAILSYHNPLWFQIFIPCLIFTNFKKYCQLPNLCKFGLLFLSGLSISLFLPLRTTEKEILILSYAPSFVEFLRIFFKVEFSSYIRIFNIPEYFLTLLFFIYHLLRQATAFLIIFAIIGFFLLVRLHKKIAMFLLSIFLFNTIIFAFLFKVSIEDFVYSDRIWFPAFLSFFIFLGYGIAKVLENRILKKKNIILVTILIFSLNSCLRHYFEIKEAGTITPYAYGKEILFQVDENSLLFINDIGFYYSLLYLQHIEKIKKDIPVICCNYLNYYSYRKDLEINKKISISLTKEEEKAPYSLDLGEYNWELILNLCDKVALKYKDKDIFLLPEPVFEQVRIRKKQKLLKINTQDVFYNKRNKNILPIKKFKGRISNEKLSIFSIIREIIYL